MRKVPLRPAGSQHLSTKSTPPSPRLSTHGWRRFARLGEARRREYLTIQVKYTGGAEAYYVVRARGAWGRFPGYAALHDVMQDVYNDRGGAPGPA